MVTVGTIISAVAPSAEATELPLLVVTQSTDAGYERIAVVEDGGATVRVLVDLGDRDAFDPAISPDGTEVLFAAEKTPGGRTAIFSVDATIANGPITQVTFPPLRAADASPAWSPDGTMMAFERRTGGSSRIRYGVPGGADQQLTQDFSPTMTQRQPTWSPDGSSIVFAGRDSVWTPAEPSPPENASYHYTLQRADIGALPTLPTTLFAQDGTDVATPDVSPDGSLIAFAVWIGGDPKSALLHTASLDVELHFTYAGAVNPDFSPDGNRIVADVDIVHHAAFTSLPGYLWYDTFVQGGNAMWFPTIPVDDVAPELTLTPDRPATNGVWGGRVEMTASTTDDRPGEIALSCTIDGQPASGYKMVGPGVWSYVFSVPGFEPGVTPNGRYEAACTATDGAGNASHSAFDVVIDGVGPRLVSSIVGQPAAEIGAKVRVSACVKDPAGVQSVEAQVRRGTVFLTHTTGCHFVGRVRVWRFSYPFQLTMTDVFGNESFAPTEQGVMVFDRDDAVAGTGAITVSTTPTWPSSTEELPRSADIDVGYGATGIFPVGTLAVSYGGATFHATSFEWITPSIADQMWVFGSGSFEGSSDVWRFDFLATDFDPFTDSFELRLWGAADTSNPTYTLNGRLSTGDLIITT